MTLYWRGPERYEVISNVLTLNNLLTLNKGVEIGTRHGDTAEYLLKVHKKLELICIDSYPAYVDIPISHAWTIEEQDEVYRVTKKRLALYHFRCKLVREDSLKASEAVENGSLDFIFIDAEHTEAKVYADIYAWYTKVRAGGAVMGHDYRMDPVNKVVNEFVAKFGKELVVSDPNSDVWMFQI